MAMLFKRNYYLNLQKTVKTLSSLSGSKGVLNAKYSSSANVNVPQDFEVSDEISQQNEIDIENKRDVSQLKPHHKNLVNGKVPYPEPMAEIHSTVKYRRKMYGIYGSESGVNPGIMWPTIEELKERKEYESIAYPFTIQEMVRAEVSKREAEETEIMERQKKIQQNLSKLDQWMKDLKRKRADKIKLITEAKAKNDRLTEEVRRHFGYTVDHRDERFQLMLEQKLKEEKKLAKQEKKKRHDERMLQELMAQMNVDEKQAK